MKQFLSQKKNEKRRKFLEQWNHNNKKIILFKLNNEEDMTKN